MLNIAIDGPCGAGKSTISKMVANRLGITYLDTGAMYRAVALYVLRRGYDVTDAEAVVPLLGEIGISYRNAEGGSRILLNGEDVSDAIRVHSISKAASDVSKIPQVREFLVKMQRKIASENDVVLDGRDITSNVLPDARFKFYLTADIRERARRRHEELKTKGSDLSFETVLEDIRDRDRNDMTRAVAPLVKTADSILIDSTELGIEQVVALIVEAVKRG